MKLPYILLVDDDTQVLRAIQRDVREHYREDYKVVATESAHEALDLVRELKLRNESVALIISDQRMPEMEGVDLLEKAAESFPEAKRMLLTAYSDIDVAIRAINTVRLDHYLLKPWHPAEEKLFPVVNDLLDQWQAQFKPDREAIRIIGFQWSPRSHQLKEFLSGNLVPYIWMDIERDGEAGSFLTSAQRTRSDLPMVVLRDGTVLPDPEITDLAAAIGLQQKASHTMYDVLIIGAGPAGLAASVYGSCEGLKTLVIERNNPGGQASSSARIENYLGFPVGLSGADLTRRAVAQTLRFGTEILTPADVKRITVRDGYKVTELSNGTEIFSKTIVISTGVAYTRLEAEGIEKFTGAGVYYGAAAIEANACKGKPIYIVGGGNSACQAALYMAKFASEVNILIRRDSLSQVAADYLVQNISKVPNIRVIPHTEVAACHGGTELESVTLVHTALNEQRKVEAKALFIYIGTHPGTNWLDGLVLLDDKGFIVSGHDLLKEGGFAAAWKLKREPYMSETSIPGIFAAGDVRSGALTGISSAVGEGSMAIRFVRKYLQET